MAGGRRAYMAYSGRGAGSVRIYSSDAGSRVRQAGGVGGGGGGRDWSKDWSKVRDARNKGTLYYALRFGI